MSAAKIENPCAGCSAACCRYVAAEIDRPGCKRDYDNIRWHLMHRGVNVFVDHDGSWFIEFESPCDNLTKDGRCSRYASRPRICREHGDGPEECEHRGETKPYSLCFRDSAQFEAWLDSRGMDWRWRR